MTPANSAAATTNSKAPVANTKPIIRAIPRISRSKPSIAPAGERSRRRDELNSQRLEGVDLRDCSADVPHACGIRAENRMRQCHPVGLEYGESMIGASRADAITPLRLVYA